MTRWMLPLLSAALLAALVGLAPVSGEENDSSATPRPPLARDITEAQVKAVERGLRWLSEEQNPDGSFNEETRSNLAVTSLAVMALMANGNTENRGRYCEQVRDGIAFLLRHVTVKGRDTSQIPVGYIHLKGDDQSRMHGHGYATQALALAYGMGTPYRREELRTGLIRAIKVIERSQDQTGGWWYQPVSYRHEGSVTVCQVQALRTAREAGIPVRKSTIDRAIRYLVKSQDPESGGFNYALDIPKRQSFALTAAALSTLFGLGQYHRDRMVENGLEYLERYADYNLRGRAGWFFYGNYYAAQALWQAAANEKFAHYWRTWWPPMREHLVFTQRRAGYWLFPGGSLTAGLGGVYATSFATLILQVPFEILPTFQR